MLFDRWDLRSAGVFFLTVIFSQKINANTGANTDICSPTTATELFKCLNDQHIETKKAKLEIKKTEGSVDQAAKSPNPELGSSAIVGDNFGQTTFETEIDLQFTVELGGKKSARVEHAEVEKNLAQIDSLLACEQANINSGITVLRLKQLEKEIESFKEALETFSRIENQYRSRGRLSPEQEVSLAVFEVAARDAALKLNSLLDDQRVVQDTVAVSVKFPSNFDWKKISFKDFKPVFPEKFISKKEDPEIKQDPHILKASFENLKADKALQLERSNAWPDLKIGPVARLSTEGSSQFYAGGISLSLPLPLLNTNKGARAVALAELEKSTLESNRKISEAALLKIRLMDSYNRLRSHTSQMNDLESLDKKHRRLEALFSQGIISSALVIESHRQLLEFLQEYHTAERTQLETLWKLYSIEGRLEKEIIL